MKQQTLNFLLVGDDEQGKHEIMNSLPNYRGTYKSTDITLYGEKIDLNIWESGARQFPYIYRFFARSVEGIILVYDLLQRHTFKYLSLWVRNIRRIAPTVPVILVANNKHLEINRTVKEKKARAFAKKNDMEYLEISCYCNYRVDEALCLLARKALKKNAVQRFWTQSGISTLEDLCLRKVITCLQPDTNIDELPITGPMKEALRLHLPKPINEERRRRFLRLKNIQKLFTRGDNITSNNSVQLPHDRIKPNRAYNHFVSRNWLKLPFCLTL